MTNLANRPTPTDTKPPEAVALFIAVARVMIGLEVLHQLLSAAMSLLDRDAARALLRTQLAEAQTDVPLSDSLLDAALMIAVVGAVILAVAVLALLAWLLVLLRRRHRWAAKSRRLLIIFSLYLLIRGTLVVVSGPTAASMMPLAWYAIDGSVQILIAVAGAITMIFGTRADTVRWVEGKEPERN